MGLSVLTSHVPNRQEGKPGLSLNGKMPSDQCLIPQLCFDMLSHQLCRIFGLVTCVTLWCFVWRCCFFSVLQFWVWWNVCALLTYQDNWLEHKMWDVNPHIWRRWRWSNSYTKRGVVACFRECCIINCVVNLYSVYTLCDIWVPINLYFRFVIDCYSCFIHQML